MANGDGKRRRRIWVQHVAVETDKLRMRLKAAQARGGLDAAQEVIAQGIYAFLDKARDAAFREDPVPRRWQNWWRGTLVEAAYRNLHAARAQMVDLYDPNQLRAEIPLVVARADTVMHRDDVRRTTVADLEAESVDSLRPHLRRVISDSYEQIDLEHAQLRSFRNILYLAASFIVAAVVVTLIVVSARPTLVPLCFPNELTLPTGATTVQGWNCPTGSGVDAAQAADVLVVAMLGALGGALAATVSIRNLNGTSTPYDVPVALAVLKVPLGALTALLALVAIQGKFVPGLSVLDSQGQILAYALIFGFAQQVLSRLLDRQAQTLLDGLPGGATTAPAAPGPGRLAPPVPAVAPVLDVAPAPAVAAAVADPDGDRPVEEPGDATAEDQLQLLRETGNERQDMTEAQEADLLQQEFGPPDANGIYGAPATEGRP